MPKQRSAIPPRCKVHYWYAELPNKMQVVDRIRAELNYKYSTTAVIQWLNGLVDTKKTEQLDAISKVSGIPSGEIYKPQ